MSDNMIMIVDYSYIHVILTFYITLYQVISRCASIDAFARSTASWRSCVNRRSCFSSVVSALNAWNRYIMTSFVIKNWTFSKGNGGWCGCWIWDMVRYDYVISVPFFVWKFPIVPDLLWNWPMVHPCHVCTGVFHVSPLQRNLPASQDPNFQEISQHFAILSRRKFFGWNRWHEKSLLDEHLPSSKCCKVDSKDAILSQHDTMSQSSQGRPCSRDAWADAKALDIQGTKQCPIHRNVRL